MRTPEPTDHCSFSDLPKSECSHCGGNGCGHAPLIAALRAVVEAGDAVAAAIPRMSFDWEKRARYDAAREALRKVDGK